MLFTYGYTHSIRAETVWVSSGDRLEYALFLQVLKTYNSRLVDWYSVWKLVGICNVQYGYLNTRFISSLAGIINNVYVDWNIKPAKVVFN